MQTRYLEREEKDSIPYVFNTGKGFSCIVIMVHALGGSKTDHIMAVVGKALLKKGVGIFAFDLPAHGDYESGEDSLRMENCLADLYFVEESLRRMFPHAKIGYYGYGFGAFLLLTYLRRNAHPDARVLLHSASVTLPEVLRGMGQGKKDALEKDGYLAIRQENGRPLKLLKAFLEDVSACDLFDGFDHHGAWIKMIHGCDDEWIDYRSAMRFAEGGDIIFRAIANGDHALSSQDVLPKVLKEFRGFYAGAGVRWYAPEVLQFLFRRSFYLELDCSAEEVRRALGNRLYREAEFPWRIGPGDFKGDVWEDGFRLELIRRTINRTQFSGTRLDGRITEKEQKTSIHINTGIDDPFMFGVMAVAVLSLLFSLLGIYQYVTGHFSIPAGALIVFSGGLSAVLSWWIFGFIVYIRDAEKMLISVLQTIKPDIQVRKIKSVEHDDTDRA